MKKCRLSQVLAALAIVVSFVCGQQAVAQSRHHLQARLMPGTHQAKVGPSGFDELFQLAAGFGALPPKDANGFDEWPCFPNPADSNYPDCSTIANGGVVIGTPAFTWSLAACDASSPSSTNCGQVFWFYEDDTGDNSDHLFVSVVVKQGLNYILNTGDQDLGPNPFPIGSLVVISDDAAFGTLGEPGKGNGYCFGSKKECSDPLRGIATVTVTTKVGPSKISSKFNINLQ